jgi:hypothetical protein
MESRDATLEAETAELHLRLNQVPSTSAPAQPPESEVPEGFLIPHCVLYSSEEVYRTAFAMNPWVNPKMIESFFTYPSVTATWENGTLYQMCYSGRHEVAFIVYGEFEGFIDRSVVYACRGGSNTRLPRWAPIAFAFNRLLSPPAEVSDGDLCRYWREQR